MRKLIFLITIIYLTGCSTEDLQKCGSSMVTEKVKSEIVKNYDSLLQPNLEINVSVAEETSFEKEKNIRNCKAIANVTVKKELLEKFDNLQKVFEKELPGWQLYSFKNDSEKKLIYTEDVGSIFKVKKNEVDKGVFVEGTYESKNNFKMNPIILYLVEDAENILKAGRLLQSLHEVKDMGSDSDGISSNELISKIMQNKLKIESCQLLQPKFEVVCKISNEGGSLELLTTKSVQGNPLIEIFRSEQDLKISDPGKLSDLLNTNLSFKSKDLKSKTSNIAKNWGNAFGL